MNIVAQINESSLPGMVRRAAHQLASATNAAEILDAKDAASVIYDAAKKAARMARAKGAHDTLIAAAHRAQADALEIEAMAKRRLADEYDAAQERGEVRTRADNQRASSASEEAVSAADIGLTHKDIHEARLIRDAEVAEPGIARRALDARLAQGLEPNKAALREAVIEAARQGYKQSPQSNRNPHYRAPTRAGSAWAHLYGNCRAMAEWATEENMSLAISGWSERGDNQAANVAAVRNASAILNRFLENIDEQ